MPPPISFNVLGHQVFPLNGSTLTTKDAAVFFQQGNWAVGNEILRIEAGLSEAVPWTGEGETAPPWQPSERQQFIQQLLTRISKGQQITQADFNTLIRLGISQGTGDAIRGFLAGDPNFPIDAVQELLTWEMRQGDPTIPPADEEPPPGWTPPTVPYEPQPGEPGGPSIPEEPMDVGGGMEQARLALDALIAAQQAELGRQGVGLSFLDYITETQRDPFSIVPATQMYGAAGGGTLAPTVAQAQGMYMQSPYGDIAQRLIDALAQFTTGGVPGEPPKEEPPPGPKPPSGPGPGPTLPPASGDPSYESWKLAGAPLPGTPEYDNWYAEWKLTQIPPRAAARPAGAAQPTEAATRPRETATGGQYTPSRPQTPEEAAYLAQMADVMEGVLGGGGSMEQSVSGGIARDLAAITSGQWTPASANVGYWNQMQAWEDAVPGYWEWMAGGRQGPLPSGITGIDEHGNPIFGVPTPGPYDPLADITPPGTPAPAAEPVQATIAPKIGEIGKLGEIGGKIGKIGKIGRIGKFRRGGSLTTDEPMIGVGAWSGLPRFTVGEEGRKERLTVEPMQKGGTVQAGRIGPPGRKQVPPVRPVQPGPPAGPVQPVPPRLPIISPPYVPPPPIRPVQPFPPGQFPTPEPKPVFDQLAGPIQRTSGTTEVPAVVSPARSMAAGVPSIQAGYGYTEVPTIVSPAPAPPAPRPSPISALRPTSPAAGYGYSGIPSLASAFAASRTPSFAAVRPSLAGAASPFATSPFAAQRRDPARAQAEERQRANAARTLSVLEALRGYMAGAGRREQERKRRKRAA